MECKNCNAALSKEDDFCSKCGAKVIKNRLTLKIVFSDFFATFISWDNTLLKTFITLFKNPEKVINSYINGTRKKFIKPFTYLLIVLSLYGIYMLFSTDIILKAINDKYVFNNNEMSFDKEFVKQMKQFGIIFSKYHNLMFLSLIPVYAFLSKIVYRKKTYNYVEHIIIQTYIQAQVLVTTALAISFLLIFSANILITSNFLSILMYVYYIYVFKKVFNLSIAETILKFLLIALLFIAIIIGISIGIAIIYGLTLKFKNGM